MGTHRHETPYPSSADRHVSFSEMIYHLGFIHEDIKEVKDIVQAQAADRAAVARWRWGLFVAAGTGVASLAVQLFK